MGLDRLGCEKREHGEAGAQQSFEDLASELLNSAVKMELRRIGIIPVSHHLQVEQKEDDEWTEQSRVGEAAGRRNCPEAVPEEQRGRKRKYVPSHEN